MEEFRVTTSNANADSGRSAGAQVSLVTKAGTNQLHGSLYEYNRNTDFAANDYFLKASELASGQPNQRSPWIRKCLGAEPIPRAYRAEPPVFSSTMRRRRRRVGSAVRVLYRLRSLRAGSLNSSKRERRDDHA